MFNADAIKAIRDELRKPFEVGDFLVAPNDWTVKDKAALVQHGPQAEELEVNTLGAVRDYLTANRDGLDLSKIVVHVESPRIVRVLGPLDARSRARESYLVATVPDLAEHFVGQFQSHENLIIGLQTRFEDVEQRQAVIKLFSSVKSEEVKTSLDDGISQVVTARNGGVLVADVAVPNPVSLAPYRTFRDFSQVPSLFVMRAQSGREGGLPLVGLFEADGGAWKLEAVKRVREWLEENLPETVEVLA